MSFFTPYSKHGICVYTIFVLSCEADRKPNEIEFIFLLLQFISAAIFHNVDKKDVLVSLCLGFDQLCGLDVSTTWRTLTIECLRLPMHRKPKELYERGHIHLQPNCVRTSCASHAWRSYRSTCTNLSLELLPLSRQHWSSCHAIVSAAYALSIYLRLQIAPLTC